MFENEKEEEISLSSFRYGKLVFLYNNWKNAWKQAVILGFITTLFSIPFYENNIKNIVFAILFIFIGIGMITCGLRGRKVMNNIKNNFQELELDMEELD